MSEENLKKAPVKERSRMETVLLTPEIVDAWKIPPFQRQLRVNDKVREIAEKIKGDGGVVPGILVLGVISGRAGGTYVIDGQHRLQAFRLSECGEGFADVRIVENESMADMGRMFIELNSRIVNMKPDDLLKALEPNTPVLRNLRERCSWIGYDNLRRGPANAIVSASIVIRAWYAAGKETPSATGASANGIVEQMSDQDGETLVEFMETAMSAWGRGPDTSRLWGSLNMALCMYLWKRLVLNVSDDAGKRRYLSLTPKQFEKCIMSVAADESYYAWLLGRALSERDRSPCYNRLKNIFVRRLKADAVSAAPKLPQPHWSVSA